MPSMQILTWLERCSNNAPRTEGKIVRVDSRKKKNSLENEPIDLPSCSSASFFYPTFEFLRVVPLQRFFPKNRARINEAKEAKVKENTMKSSTRFFPFLERSRKGTNYIYFVGMHEEESERANANTANGRRRSGGLEGKEKSSFLRLATLK